jgi:hypothetical protein
MAAKQRAPAMDQRALLVNPVGLRRDPRLE